jgi:hypothetical protein
MEWVNLVVVVATLAILIWQEVRRIRDRPKIEIDWAWPELLGESVRFENHNPVTLRRILVVPQGCALRGTDDRALVIPALAEGDGVQIALTDVTDDSYVLITWKDPYRNRTQSTWFPAYKESPLAEVRLKQQAPGWEKSQGIRKLDRTIAGPQGVLTGSAPASTEKLEKLTKQLKAKAAKESKRP